MVAAESSAKREALRPSSAPDLCPMEGDPHAVEDGEGEPMIFREEDDEEECAPVRLAPEPGEPSAEQVEQHRTTHLPYRSWCEECVKGRGTGEQHRAGPGSSMPVLACDYLLVTRHGVFRQAELSEGNRKAILLKILVLKDAKSKFVSAHVVPTKGLGEDRYAAEKLRRDVLWLGYPRIILKSDNEPSLVAVTKEVLKALKVEVLDQSAAAAPPAYDSKANGSVENAVKLVQGLLRTLKECLEKRIRHRIPPDHAIMAWLVHHTAWLLTVQAAMASLPTNACEGSHGAGA